MRDHAVAVATDELLEGAKFVCVTELGRAPQQFVIVGLDRGAATELGIECAQQGIFAPRGGREVRCAVDDLIVGDEHVATVGERADSRAQPPVLPMSSTPLPFQRNFTMLSSPSVSLEYRSATVSPVLADVSMPLKP